MAAGVRPRRGYSDGRTRAGRAEAAQRDHLRRRRPSPRFGQPHRYTGALQHPHRRRVLRQQPLGVSHADDAERRRDCHRTLPGRHGAVRQPALYRLSAVSDRELRPACRHTGPRRRRSVRTGGPQRLLRRQLLARSVASRVCAFLRIQHGRSRKDRACRSAGCDGSGPDSRSDAGAGHDHSRRGDRHAAHSAACAADGRTAESGRPATGAAAAKSAGRHEHRARNARRERRAPAMVRRRRHQGYFAGVREERRAIRARVLVGRS